MVKGFLIVFYTNGVGTLASVLWDFGSCGTVPKRAFMCWFLWGGV